jgi:hypothetical protein
MWPPSELLSVAVLASSALTANRIPHAIGGSLALGLLGAPRDSHDVDLNVFLGESDHDPALAALVGAGFLVDLEEPGGAIGALLGLSEVPASEVDPGESYRGATVQAFFGGIAVDLFFPPPAFGERASRRVLEIWIGGSTLPVLSPEDLVVAKIMSFRGKDLEDANRLLEVRGASLDSKYVEEQIARCSGDDAGRVGVWGGIWLRRPDPARDS